MRNYCSLAERVIDQDHKLGDKVALVTETEVVTYRELIASVINFAGNLRQCGIKKGNQICLLLPNGKEFAIALLGSTLAGATVVPLNPYFKEEELSYYFDISEFVGVIGESQTFDVISKLESVDDKRILMISVGTKSYTVDLETYDFNHMYSNPPKRKFNSGEFECDIRDDFIIGYTSGTTGRPKGAILSHHNVLRQLEAIAEAEKLDSNDTVACAQPFFLVSTMMLGLLLPLYLGGTACVQKRLNVKQFISWLKEYKVTLTFGVPTLYYELERAAQEDEDKSSFYLRYCMHGGSGMSDKLKQSLIAKYGFNMCQSYGGTEVPCSATINLSGRKLKSAGKPLGHLEIVILDEQQNKLGPNEIGEVCIRGKESGGYELMKGYWKMPKETAETLADGLLRMGDLGYLDEEGFLYLVDRKKDMLKVSGFCVFPAEVEQVLLQHPSINECAVVGKPDERQGEIPVAVITVNEGHSITPEELIQYSKLKLTGYKSIKDAVIFDEMPKNSHGKISKNNIREQLGFR